MRHCHIEISTRGSRYRIARREAGARDAVPRQSEVRSRDASITIHYRDNGALASLCKLRHYFIGQCTGEDIDSWKIIRKLVVTCNIYAENNKKY